MTHFILLVNAALQCEEPESSSLYSYLFISSSTVPIFVLSSWAAPLKITLKKKLNLQTQFAEALDLNQILIVLNSIIEAAKQFGLHGNFRLKLVICVYHAVHLTAA